MNRETTGRILGAVYSMTYSLYPIEMTEERTALVRRALQMTGEAPSEEAVEQLLFALHQSKYDLNPGCQCLFNNGYYPDDFTDVFRKMDLQEEDGRAARELFAVLQKPHPDWDTALFYCAVRATYNDEYHAERIREIQRMLIRAAAE